MHNLNHWLQGDRKEVPYGPGYKTAAWVAGSCGCRWLKYSGEDKPLLKSWGIVIYDSICFEEMDDGNLFIKHVDGLTICGEYGATKSR